VRSAVAGNWSTPPNVVHALTSDPDGYVRAGTVDNLERHAQVARLQTLARDPDAQVRLEVAKINVWIDGLHAHLPDDEDELVREELVQHQELPAAAMLKLAADPSETVRIRLAARDGLTRAVLEKLVVDPSAEVRQALAYNKAEPTPVWLLERLASDPDDSVRWQVAYNGHTPAKVLEVLRQDPIEYVRNTAMATLER
jgi:HEAT repeat protein